MRGFAQFSTKPAFHRIYLSLILVLTLCILPLSAQENGSKKEGEEEKKPSFTVPSFDSPLEKGPIQEFIKKLEGDDEVAKEASADVLKNLKNAVSLLEDLNNSKKKEETFEQKIVGKSDDLERVNQELKSFESEIDPDIPQYVPVSELETQFRKIQSETKQFEEKVNELENEKKQRDERRQKIPEKTTKLEGELEDLKKSIETLKNKENRTPVEESLFTQLRARKRFVEQELKTLQKEQEFIQARDEILDKRLQLAINRRNRAQKREKIWQEQLNQRRRWEAEQEREQAEKALKEAKKLHPILEQVARNNKEYAEKRSGKNGTTQQIEDISSRVNTVEQQLKEIENVYSQVQERVETVGLTPSVGMYLRRQRSELSEKQNYQQKLQDQEQRIAQLQFEILNIEEKIRELQNPSEEIQQILDRTEDVPKEEREKIKERLEDLFSKRKQLLSDLKSDYEKLFDKLVNLTTVEKQLLNVRNDFQQFIEERILWIRSSTAISFETIQKSKEGFEWFFAPASWQSISREFIEDIKKNYVVYSLIALLFLLLLVSRLWLRDRLEKIGQATFSQYADFHLHTPKALLYTLLLTLPLPGILFLFGYRLRSLSQHLVGEVQMDGLSETALLAHSCGTAFMFTALIYATLKFVRYTCTDDGLAEQHFLWPSEVIARLKRSVSWFKIPALPLVFILVTFQQTEEDLWIHSTGRFSLIGLMICLTFLFHVLASPTRGILSDHLKKHKDSWLYQLRYFWYALLLLSPLFLAFLSVIGYHYSAYQLSKHLLYSIWLFLGLFFLVWSLIRVQQVVMTKIEQKKKKEELQKKREEREKQEQQKQAEVASTDKDSNTSDGTDSLKQDPVRETQDELEEEIDPTQINEQSQKILWSCFFAALALGLWMIWGTILPALRMLDTIVLWQYSMSAAASAANNASEAAQIAASVGAVTLADLLLAGIVTVIVIVFSSNLEGVLEITLFQYTEFEQGIRYAAETLLRYLVYLIGLIMVARTLGLRWADVQWLAAAMTVGLGFGLQEIFANFISGIILLFEQPMAVGDIVTIGDTSGTVTRIRMRSTTIRTWDYRELVIPNKDFITGELLNWSLSDNILRQEIPVGVSYNTDPRKARQLLLDISDDHEQVLEDPQPNVIFKEFGDNALIFELRIFLQDFSYYWSVKTSVMNWITEQFREEGIEISFPQRDLHLRSMDDSITLNPEQAEEPPADSDEKPPEDPNPDA